MAGSGKTGWGFGGTSAGDTTAPAIVFSPTPPATIVGSATLQVSVTDANLKRVVISAEYPSGAHETVFTNGAFTSAFSGSVRQAIAGGFTFLLTRNGGWGGSPTLHVLAYDSAGNETPASAAYSLATSAAVVTAEDVTDCSPHDPVQITNYVARGKARLIEQYKNKPRVEAVLESGLIQVQALEDAAFQVINADIFTATGDALAKWGKIVGQENPGLPDDDYRVLILTRIAVNRSNGHPDELIRIVQLIGELFAEDPVIMYASSDASYAIFIDSDIGTIDPQVIADLLDDADQSGVEMGLTVGRSTTADLFLWASTRGTVPGNGFASTRTASQGGVMSSARG